MSDWTDPIDDVEHEEVGYKDDTSMDVPKTTNAFGSGAFAKPKTAAEAVAETEAGGFGSFPEEIVLKGKFYIKVRKGKENVKYVLMDGNDNPVKAITFNLGDGSPLEEDLGHCMKSQVWVTNQQQRQCIQEGFDTYFPEHRFKIPKVITSFGEVVNELQNSKGECLPVSIWDNLVMSFVDKEEKSKAVWQNYNINWTKGSFGGDSKQAPPVFNYKGKKEHEKYFLQLENLGTIPKTEVPNMQDGKSARVFSFSSWAGKGFQKYRAACGVAYASYKGVDVSTVLRGAVMSEFEAEFAQLRHICYSHDFTGKNGAEVCHPKFFTPLGEVWGMALWDAIQSNNYPTALSSKAKPIKLDEDKANLEWVTICGPKAENSKGNIVTVSAEKDPRKKL